VNANTIDGRGDSPEANRRQCTRFEGTLYKHVVCSSLEVIMYNRIPCSVDNIDRGILTFDEGFHLSKVSQNVFEDVVDCAS
jgi:hypothetical protein